MTFAELETDFLFTAAEPYRAFGMRVGHFFETQFVRPKGA